VIVAGGSVDVVLLVQIPGVIGPIAGVILKRDTSQTREARDGTMLRVSVGRRARAERERHRAKIRTLTLISQSQVGSSQPITSLLVTSLLYWRTNANILRTETSVPTSIHRLQPWRRAAAASTTSVLALFAAFARCIGHRGAPAGVCPRASALDLSQHTAASPASFLVCRRYQPAPGKCAAPCSPVPALGAAARGVHPPTSALTPHTF
jgi:hypothetical protein